MAPSAAAEIGPARRMRGGVTVRSTTVDGLPAPEVDSLGSVRLDGVWIGR
jgi:hypothetical protein